MSRTIRILNVLNFNRIPLKKANENVYYVSFVGSSAKKILNWVYEDSKIFLPRKRATYNHILTSDNDKLMNDHITIGCRYNTQMSEKYDNIDIFEAMLETSQ